MKWLRLYNELRHDPKVQNLRHELFHFWINLLCFASAQEERGIIPTIDAVATDLGMRRDHVERFMASLEAAQLVVRRPLDDHDSPLMTPLDGSYDPLIAPLGSYEIYAWDERQPRSDDIATRVKKHRERTSGKSNGEVKPDKKRYTEEPCNVIERDSDTESDRNDERPPPTRKPTQDEDPQSDPAYLEAVGAVRVALGEEIARDLGRSRLGVRKKVAGRWECIAAAATEVARQISQDKDHRIRSRFGLMISIAEGYASEPGPPPMPATVPFKPKPVKYHTRRSDRPIIFTGPAKKQG